MVINRGLNILDIANSDLIKDMLKINKEKLGNKKY